MSTAAKKRIEGNAGDWERLTKIERAKFRLDRLRKKRKGKRREGRIQTVRGKNGKERVTVERRKCLGKAGRTEGQ